MTEEGILIEMEIVLEIKVMANTFMVKINRGTTIGKKMITINPELVAPGIIIEEIRRETINTGTNGEIESKNDFMNAWHAKRRSS